MKTIDIGAIFLTYDFIVGVLLMLASDRLGTYAGLINKSRRVQIVRLTSVSTFTLGASVAALSATIYLLFYILKLGV